MEATQLAHFNQKPSAAARNADMDAVHYAEKYLVKGNLTLSELGTPSQDHNIRDQAEFEHTYLQLILSDYLPPTDVENSNKSSKYFTHFHRMLLHAEPNIINKLFQYDRNHASQTTMPTECRLQFLF